MPIGVNWGSKPIDLGGTLEEKVVRLTALLAYCYFLKGVNTPVSATALHAESRNYLTAVRNALEAGHTHTAETLVSIGLLLLEACRATCMKADED